jgi:hypothetical protein
MNELSQRVEFSFNIIISAAPFESSGVLVDEV